MATEIRAWKQKIEEPIISWVPFKDDKFVCFKIDSKGIFQTKEGPMEKVVITYRSNLLIPGTDVAAHIGNVATGGEAVELWFWKDEFYMKARGDGTTMWYKDKCYLLYPVTVILPE